MFLPFFEMNLCSMETQNILDNGLRGRACTHTNVKVFGVGVFFTRIVSSVARVLWRHYCFSTKEWIDNKSDYSAWGHSVVTQFKSLYATDTVTLTVLRRNCMNECFVRCFWLHSIVGWCAGLSNQRNVCIAVVRVYTFRARRSCSYSMLKSI